ncbi:MAG: 50S ribosomal protein L25/general stress protein Ctc [Anaplasma sp.]
MDHEDMVRVDASVRAGCGTSSARALRAAGLMPAVVYGKGRDPISISLSQKDFLRECRAGPILSKLVQLCIDGREEYALIKAIQKHPVSGTAVHVDFQFVDRSTEVKVEVPLVFLNEQKCAGVRFGGVLNILQRSLLVRCAPDAIPQSFEVDLLELGTGHSIRVSDLALPESTQLAMREENPVIVSVSAASVEVEEKEGEEAAATPEGRESAGEDSKTQADAQDRDASGTQEQAK